MRVAATHRHPPPGLARRPPVSPRPGPPPPPSRRARLPSPTWPDTTASGPFASESIRLDPRGPPSDAARRRYGCSSRPAPTTPTPRRTSPPTASATTRLRSNNTPRRGPLEPEISGDGTSSLPPTVTSRRDKKEPRHLPQGQVPLGSPPTHGQRRPEDGPSSPSMVASNPTPTMPLGGSSPDHTNSAGPPAPRPTPRPRPERDLVGSTPTGSLVDPSSRPGHGHQPVCSAPADLRRWSPQRSSSPRT